MKGRMLMLLAAAFAYTLHAAAHTPVKAGRWKTFTCCSPSYPYANMASLEHPVVEGRILLGYLTWLYRADGFLFWHVNNWRADNEPMDETDTYFPLWNTWSHLKTPGDGIFLYPGKEHILPSIRLANIRDGEEDYEYLLRAEKALGAQDGGGARPPVNPVADGFYPKCRRAVGA